MAEQKDWPGTPGMFGLGSGPEYCVCPKCGHEEKHGDDEPCWEKKCPQCEEKMEEKTLPLLSPERAEQRSCLLGELITEMSQEDSEISLWLAERKAEIDTALLYHHEPRSKTWTRFQSRLMVAGLKLDEDLKIDLGYGSKAPADFLGIDMQWGYGDIMYNLEEGIPVPSDRATEIRAWNFLEHISNPQFMMEEIWFVLKDKGQLVFQVPSTKGEGAFANPDHKSFWNQLAFQYYIEDDLRAAIGTIAKFRIIELEEWANEEKGTVYVRGILEAIKTEEGMAEFLASGAEVPSRPNIHLVEQAEKAVHVKVRNPEFSSFKSFKGEDGRHYWVAISGSSFLDRVKEIISREAFDFSIRYHDFTGLRGPLRIYHFEGSEVGDCLLSLRVENFLIEAGVWYDTDLATAAREWVDEEDSEPAISVGFFFDPEQFISNIYKQIIVFERSLIQSIDSACPWTLLENVKEEDTMATEAQLAALIGEERAKEIVARAKTKSKELVEEGVAFRDVEGSEDSPEEVIETPAEGTDEESTEVEEETAPAPEEVAEEVEEGAETSTEVEEEEEDEELKVVEELVLPDETVAALVEAFAAAVTPQLDALTTSVEGLGERVTELEKPIEEKVKAEVARQPRVVVRRASKDVGNIVEKAVVPVLDPDAVGGDYENETPEERSKRLGTFWQNRQKKVGEEETDLGE